MRSASLCVVSFLFGVFITLAGACAGLGTAQREYESLPPITQEHAADMPGDLAGAIAKASRGDVTGAIADVGTIAMHAQEIAHTKGEDGKELGWASIGGVILFGFLNRFRHRLSWIFGPPDPRLEEPLAEVLTGTVPTLAPSSSGPSAVGTPTG